MSHIKQFEDNYIAIQVPANTKRGFKVKYIYYGPYFHFCDETHSLTVNKWILGSLHLFGLIFYLTAVFQNIGLNYSKLVGIPSVLSLIPLLFESLGIMRFCSVGKKIKRPAFLFIRRCLMAAPITRFFLQLLTILACIVSFSQIAFSLQGGLNVLCHTVSCITSALIFRHYNSLRFTSEESTVLKDYADQILQ